jgi:hypothetical protein
MAFRVSALTSPHVSGGSQRSIACTASPSGYSAVTLSSWTFTNRNQCAFVARTMLDEGVEDHEIAAPMPMPAEVLRRSVMPPG